MATVHDLLVTFAFLAFFGYDLTLNVIAALLTITGFSTNDTIVIFDRVRENLRGMRRDSLGNIINVAINQTLGRTIITSGTALLSSLALLFFGGDVLHGFAFTMVVGIITGTYSTVFIAAAIVSFWRGAGPTRAAAHATRAGDRAANSPLAGRSPRGRLARRRLSAGRFQPGRAPRARRGKRNAESRATCRPLFKPRFSGSSRDSPSSCRCRRLLTC